MYMALEDAWLPVLHCQRSDCMGSYRTLFKNVSNLISATPYNSLFMLQLLCVLVPAIIWFSSISVWEKNQRQWFARGVRLHWWRCRERWRGSSNKNVYSAIRLLSNCQRCKWCSYTVHTLHWWMDIQHLYDSIKIVRSLQWKSLSAQIWHTKTPEVKQWLHIYSTTMFISLMHWHTWEMLNSFGWNYAHHTTLHQQYERLKG